MRRILRGQPVLAVVAAHTHLAAGREPFRSDPGLASVPEFVVGSTTDPPQEAALLQVIDGPVRPIVHVRTIPAVAREGQTCGREVEMPLRASTCKEVIRKLLEDGACAPLREDFFAKSPRLHPRTPDEVEKVQEYRAERLLTCVCRKDSCDLPGDRFGPLLDGRRVLKDRRLFERLDRLALSGGPGPRREELVCLSWAASIMQGWKARHVDYNRALTEGFDAAVTFGAIEMSSAE